MTLLNFRARLLSGAALAFAGAIGLTVGHGEARAESVCTVDTDTTPNSFACIDTVDTEISATGTFTEGAVFGSPAHGPVSVSSTTDLDIVLSGGELTSSSGHATLFGSTSGGALNFSSSAIVSATDTRFGVDLAGQSVTADTGTINVTNGLMGAHSRAHNGNNVLTGGTTYVNGDYAKALYAVTTNGSATINTGSIVAEGPVAWGVMSWTFQDATCGTNTVNVTGNIVATNYAVHENSCGEGIINVGSGYSIANTDPIGVTIATFGTVLTTVIDGQVLAPSTGSRAIVSFGTENSTVIINDGGLLSGRFEGWALDYNFAINEGGSWITSGSNFFGTGNTALDNYGTITIDGVASFENLDTVNNSGVIDLQDGNTDGSLTITGDYVGSGSAALLVDAGQDGFDTFVIGGTASGSTQIFVTAADGVDISGLEIVTAGEMTPGAFVLANTEATQLIDYRLRQNGNALVVTSLPNIIAFQPLVIGQVSQDAWHQSARIAQEAFSHSNADARRENRVGLWGQLSAGHDRSGRNDEELAFSEVINVDSRIRTDRRGVQAGLELGAAKGAIVGATAGYQHITADFRSAPGSVKADVYNFGLYGRLQTASGFYASLLLKRDWADARLTNNAFDSASGDPNATSTGLEGEVGFRGHLGSVNFETGAGLAYVDTGIDDLSAEGIDYDFGSAPSLRGKIGGRLGWGGKIAPFVDVRLINEFAGDNKLTLSSGEESDEVKTNGHRTWAWIEAGIEPKAGRGPLFAAWAELGDVNGVGLRAGFRF